MYTPPTTLPSLAFVYMYARNCIWQNPYKQKQNSSYAKQVNKKKDINPEECRLKTNTNTCVYHLHCDTAVRANQFPSAIRISIIMYLLFLLLPPPPPPQKKKTTPPTQEVEKTMSVILLYIIMQWYYCQQPHSKLPGEKNKNKKTKQKCNHAHKLCITITIQELISTYINITTS